MFKDSDLFMKIFYQKGMKDFLFCDCYGICHLFNKHVLGKDIPDLKNEDIYSDDAVIILYKKTQKSFSKVKIGKEKKGDIISLNIKGNPIHVGVVVQKGLMLHIMEDCHAMIESYNSVRWENKVNSFWRYA